ncbi:3',5'-cyclic-AMP phosphodiesterase [Psychromonas sp. 14N.309.X.WAT.B.A12]|jgi:3',5'-cyclic-AMP phosphodiesterase|uniref:3',5'-cyclic-AMP phosphodiesterase n=1 Tax=unclassified Psychromonas TaxID=2614957 RepID=UPI0025B11C70|nr:3',5'-cyclic-AMP phosphodiesterase [Psychromonas sp. 14N.309.X.WAT.B.A12]MDN2664306.1 3',5'-cyclic-AMP phosphodiesterase [Psychromonas sp. 14N.309.X.WAT.B.A12]
MNGVNQTIVNLVPDPEGDIKLLQITDTHLFADSEKDLLGIKTVTSYDAIIKHAAKYAGQCAAVLCTGDLSQDHSAQSYVDFSDRIKTLQMPCYWLPGNHDMQEIMLPSLLAEGLAQTKQIISEHWQIILLDSQVSGVPYGHLSDSQLSFLEQKLQQHPDKHTLIAVHHHVLPVGAAWLDQHILKNNDQFIALISKFNNVNAVLSGHVHQSFDTVKNKVRYITSPSTCVQFKPQSDDFALDDKPPGYRYLVLTKSGKIETQVERLKAGEFTTDENATGY